MKVAFRLANASFFGRLISVWTRSEFQHAEIVFEYPESICFSSSEDSGGTRFIHINDLDDPKSWLVLDVPVTPEVEMKAYDYVKTNLLNLPYNWIDIISFVFHNINPDKIAPKSWICSAVCLHVLQLCNLYVYVRCVDCSPELLYELVKSTIEVDAKR